MKSDSDERDEFSEKVLESDFVPLCGYHKASLTSGSQTSGGDVDS